MSDAPLGIDSQPIETSTPKIRINIPHPLPVLLGEYGKELDKLWPQFEVIRSNGLYVSDENRQAPRFSQSIVLHGFGGKYKVESLGSHVVKHEDGSEISLPKSKFTFIPSNVDTISRISSMGVLSSDIEFEGDPQRKYFEDETWGCADFYRQKQPFNSLSEFIETLPRGTNRGFVTEKDEGDYSSTIMFAFDTSRPELAPLMKYAMKDTDPKENLWPNHIVPDQDYRMDFPVPGSGTHLAVPVGLPANYIEYIVVNEKSPYWQGERLQQLRKAAVVDGHQIPLVSIHTNEVI